MTGQEPNFTRICANYWDLNEQSYWPVLRPSILISSIVSECPLHRNLYTYRIVYANVYYNPVTFIFSLYPPTADCALIWYSSLLVLSCIYFSLVAYNTPDRDCWSYFLNGVVRSTWLCCSTLLGRMEVILLCLKFFYLTLSNYSSMLAYVKFVKACHCPT